MKPCQVLNLSDEVPWGHLEECGKPAVIEYVYRFNREDEDQINGTTCLCQEHYEETLESVVLPNPDNLIPLEDQWRKL